METAMVTGRMTPQKKEAGNAILKRAGLNASQAINRLYDRLIEHIWGPYSENDNTILRVNMANIRRKIEPNPAEPVYIFTEIGVGYRMAEED